MPAPTAGEIIKLKIPQQAEVQFLYKDRRSRHNLCEILSTSYPHPVTCGKKRKIIRANKLLKHNLILKIGVKMIKYPGINRILSICYYIITLLLRTIPNFWDFAQNTFRAGRGISHRLRLRRPYFLTRAAVPGKKTYRRLYRKFSHP